MQMSFDDSSRHAKEISEDLAQPQPRRKRRDKKKSCPQAKRQGNSKPPKYTYAGRLRRRLSPSNVKSVF
ncbi:unnamed protein product [Blumeria hordei]|nr:unnamed protein product [Blumeria hordei]